ncbi:MAG TPA: acyl-CoA dehydrogenase family protein [Novosphingobium sp.]|nr:acyl-CoA dehydrogenase family protein [Novosphingobium sp.]
MDAMVAGLRSDAETDIVAWARAFVPELRAAQTESDRLARPPEHLVEKMKRAGIYSLTVPRIYGGLQADISTWLRTVTELGRGDGGVAWAVTLVTACNWMAAGLYPKHVADKVFAKPGACVAGVFSNRAVKARRVDGGIVVDKGMWFFNSGVYQADWDLLGVPMFSEAGEPTGPGIALVPMSDVKILNDWDTIGIRGSGSSNVSMEDVFIADDHIVSLLACNEGRQPLTFPDEALYQSAFAPLMVGVLAFPVLGLGMHMLEEFVATLPKRDIKLTPYAKAGEAAVTHLQLGQASAKVEAARAIMEKVCREIDDWAAAGKYMNQAQRAALCRDSAFADQLVWEGVDLLADASGGSFSRIGNTANRIWQDVKVGTAHPFVNLASNYELYGRIMAGVEPALMPV